MDLITTTIVSGLIYDVFKMGVTEYATCVNVALKDLVLSDEEKNLIAQDFSTSSEEDRSSKESLENFFENKAPNTKQIMKNKYTQYNISQTGNGNVGVVHGDSKVSNDTYIINNPPQSIDSKKL